MEGGKEERETTPPPEDHKAPGRAGERAKRGKGRIDCPSCLPPSPEPRAGVVACEAPGFTRRERTPNRALSLARARASMASGVPRARTEARGWVVGGRLRSASLLTASHGCCLLLSLCRLRETRNLALSGVPSLTRLLAPPPALSPCRFHVLASCRSQFLAAAGKKRERYISDGKVGSLARSPGGGGGEQSLLLRLVGARGERDEERDGTMTAMRLVGNGLAKR